MKFKLNSMYFNYIFVGVIVWLALELKDFVSNGGFAHALAFNLLKITLLLISIAVFLFVNFTYNTLSLLLKTNEQHQSKKVVYKVNNFPCKQVPENPLVKKNSF